MPSIFRFAPSPNGTLHLGHAYSAMLNSDLARASGGRFLLRIEDIDPARCRPEFEAAIYQDLAWLGVAWETPVRRQSEHFGEYRRAVEVSIEVRRSIVDPHGAAVVAHYNASTVLRALVQETHNNRPTYMKQAMKNVASKANTDTANFLDVVRDEIVRVYTARENAPQKAANLIKKTRSRRV